MLAVNRYKQTLLEHYELNFKNEIIYKNDGYLGRYKKGDVVKQFKMHKLGYLGVHIPKERATVPVAHLVLLLNNITIPDNHVVDHIDGNFLNNEVSNLRVVTQAYNCKNSGKKTGKSGEKCICIYQNKYRVRVNLNGKRLNVGLFTTLDEAIKARDSYFNDRLNYGYTIRHLK